jgi:hypothetical protein
VSAKRPAPQWALGALVLVACHEANPPHDPAPSVTRAQPGASPDADIPSQARAGPPTAARAIAIAASRETPTACALDGSGAAWCWDSDAGDASAGDQPAAKCIGRLRGARQLVVGEDVACARTDDGAVMCWGSEEARQGTIDAMPLPLGGPAADVRAVPTITEQIERGQGDTTRTVVRLADGRLLAWSWHAKPSVGQAGPPATLQEMPTEEAQGDAGCERHATGHLRCRGTADVMPMRAGAPGPHFVSDHDWRDVPTLDRARDLGADAFCGWGVVDETVRQDCVYGPDGDSQSFCHGRVPACTGWRARDYKQLGTYYRREWQEYRFPHLARLVTFNVGLDDAGVAYRFDGRALKAIGTTKFRDLVRDGHGFTGLTTEGEVRQYDEPIVEDGYTIIALPGTGPSYRGP